MFDFLKRYQRYDKLACESNQENSSGILKKRSEKVVSEYKK